MGEILKYLKTFLFLSIKKKRKDFKYISHQTAAPLFYLASTRKKAATACSVCPQTFPAPGRTDEKDAYALFSLRGFSGQPVDSSSPCRHPASWAMDCAAHRQPPPDLPLGCPHLLLPLLSLKLC